MNSRGSRDWSQKEQIEIIATGKCRGYVGQHMLSVKAHPEQAGNEKNIQFLTPKEHFKAHRGNWKNDANGKLNLRTGKVEPFTNGKPNVRYKKLSDPISGHSKKIADIHYQRVNNGQRKQIDLFESIFDLKKKISLNKSEQYMRKNKEAQSRKLFDSKVSSSNNQIKEEGKAVCPSHNGNCESIKRGRGM